MPSQDQDKKKSGSGKILLAACLCVFGFGAAGGLYAYQSFGPEAEAYAAAEAAAGHAKNKDGHGAHGSPALEKATIDLGRIALSLDAGGNAARRLLVAPVIRLEGPAFEEDDEIAAKQVLRDGYIEFLSQLSVRDTAGSAGLSYIRTEMKRRAAALLPDHEVEQILFQDFVIQ